MDFEIFNILNYFFKTTKVCEHIYSLHTLIGTLLFFEVPLLDELKIKVGCFMREDDEYCTHNYCMVLHDPSVSYDKIEYVRIFLRDYHEEVKQKLGFTWECNYSLFPDWSNHRSLIFDKLPAKRKRNGKMGNVADNYYEKIKNFHIDPARIIAIELKEWKNSSYKPRNFKEMLFVHLLYMFGGYQINFDNFQPFIKDYSSLELYIRRNHKMDLFPKHRKIELHDIVINKNEKMNIVDIYTMDHFSKFFFGVINERDYDNFVNAYSQYNYVCALGYKFYKCYNSGFFYNIATVIKRQQIYLNPISPDYTDCSLMLIKPSTSCCTFLRYDLLQRLLSAEFFICEMKCFDELPEYLIQELYPHCTIRVYGEYWYKYLREGPTIVMIIKGSKSSSISILRQLAIDHREEAFKYFHIPWNRNGIHCSADINEAKENIETWTNFKNKKFIHKHYNPTPLLSLAERSILSKTFE